MFAVGYLGRVARACTAWECGSFLSPVHSQVVLGTVPILQMQNRRQIEGWSQGFVLNFWRPNNTERCTHLKHKTVNTYVLIQTRVASARKHLHTFTSHHGVMSVEADFTHLCHICMGSQDSHF